VWFTNCPMASANNVDQELGWCREEFKKIGISKSLNTIKNDFAVDKWAALEFPEQAAIEVLKEEWQRRSWSKLPAGGGLEVEGTRLG